MEKNFSQKRWYHALSIAMVIVAFTVPAKAQFVRTSYFMEGVPDRMYLNPALFPTGGYVSIPVIGSINATALSNSMGSKNISDLFDDDDSFYSNSSFRNNLKNVNRINMSVNTNVISLGWYGGKGFWSVNIGARTDVDAKIDRSLFDYLYEADKEGFKWDGTKYDIKNSEVNLNTYSEIGLGYARRINEKLSIGVKGKVLLGTGNASLEVNNIHLEENLPDENATEAEILAHQSDYYAKIATDATLKSSLKGLKLKYKTDSEGNEYVSGMKMDGYGIGGYGAALDLGLSYEILDNLTLSASVVDLGFIIWNKNSNKSASSKTTRNYDYTNYKDFEDIAGNGDVLNYEMLGLKMEDGTSSRRTSLAPTFAAGAEYALPGKKLSFGVLYTNRNTKTNDISEFTMSANYRPKNWFNIAATYSVIQSAGQSFGLGLKLGVLYIGTDYMYLGNNSKCLNAQVGITVPLGKGKMK